MSFIIPQCNNQFQLLKKLPECLFRKVLTFLDCDNLVLICKNPYTEKFFRKAISGSNAICLYDKNDIIFRIIDGDESQIIYNHEIRRNRLEEYMCYKCKKCLIDKPGIVCYGCKYSNDGKNINKCDHCFQEGYPLIKIPNCINTQRMIKYRENTYIEIELKRYGYKCCYKTVCMYGCIFKCNGIIKKDNKYIVCEKMYYNKNDNNTNIIPYGYFKDDPTNIQCTECMGNTAKEHGKIVTTMFTQLTNMVQHCTKCFNPDCIDSLCDGKCDVCKSSKYRIYIISTCSKCIMNNSKIICSPKKICYNCIKCTSCNCGYLNVNGNLSSMSIPSYILTKEKFMCDDCNSYQVAENGHNDKTETNIIKYDKIKNLFHDCS
jgi:hypothetical protein